MRRMQLSFDAADRLVELVAGAPRAGAGRRGRARALRARRAPRRRSRARCSTTSSRATRGSPGAARPSGSPTRRARDAARGRDVRRLRPRDDRPLARRARASVEIGAAARRGARARRDVRDARRPRACRCRAGSRADGIGAGDAPRRAAAGPGGAALPRVRGRRGARRAQRALRHGLPRPRGRAAHRAAAWPRRSSTPSGSPAGCSTGGRAASGSPRSRTSSAPSVEPCHRALPDAQATAEILLALIGLAQERGARDRRRPRRARRAAGAATARQALARRRCAARPRASYLFRDAHGQALYVGRARDLRARLRSYFSGERQRPAVEAALGALERVEWRVLGSSSRRRSRSSGSCVSSGRRRTRAARGLTAMSTWAARRTLDRRHRADGRRPAAQRALARSAPLARSTASRATIRATRCRRCGRAAPARGRPPLRGRRAAARPDRRARAGRGRASPSSTRLRALRACLLVPALEPGMVAPSSSPAAASLVRTLPRGGGRAARGRGRPCRGRRRAVAPSLAPEDADELLLVASFLRRPPPELRIVSLERRRRSRA